MIFFLYRWRARRPWTSRRRLLSRVDRGRAIIHKAARRDWSARSFTFNYVIMKRNSSPQYRQHPSDLLSPTWQIVGTLSKKKRTPRCSVNTGRYSRTSPSYWCMYQVSRLTCSSPRLLALLATFTLQIHSRWFDDVYYGIRHRNLTRAKSRGCEWGWLLILRCQ